MTTERQEMTSFVLSMLRDDETIGFARAIADDLLDDMYDEGRIPDSATRGEVKARIERARIVLNA